MGTDKSIGSGTIPKGVDETRQFAGNPSRSTLWRWCREGRFPPPEWIGPNRRGWRRRLLREWARDPKGWSERRHVQSSTHSDEG